MQESIWKIIDIDILAGTDILTGMDIEQQADWMRGVDIDQQAA